ncbi:hypothetical protein AMTRI_Chr08g164430 [Amborella trichopoda]
MRKETGETDIVVEGGEKANVMNLSFKLRRVNNNWVMLPNPRKRRGTSSESSNCGEKLEAKICLKTFAEIIANPPEQPMKLIGEYFLLAKT